ncbi:MAG TPA: GDP-mannose 4,6-dehydratase [Polyangiaceae bacterium]|nr:GDP-mannose 4,6-dehydratase [Polyangiaceae bacterium]
MKRALITGVTGQDGAYLARLLVDHGYQVFGSSRAAQTADLSRLRALGVTGDVQLVELDPSDAAAAASLLQAVRPDEIYHLAAQASVGKSFVEPAAAFTSAALGTLALLEGVRASGLSPRIVVAGSSEIFGGNNGQPNDEETPLNPLSPYAAGKAAAWALVRSYRRSFGLPCSVALLHNHESPLRGQSYVSQKVLAAVRQAAAGLPTTLALGDLSVIRDFGWAPEYVAALHLMALRDEPGDFVIATGESHSLRELVEQAFACAGLDHRDYVTHDPGLLRPIDIPAMRANPDKARRELGWQAKVKFDELIERLVATAREVHRES